MKHPHFEHVREHLERVRDGYAYIPDPEQVYLGRQEKDHFWELVGLRLQGCPVVVLAAIRFERLDRNLSGYDGSDLSAEHNSHSPRL